MEAIDVRDHNDLAGSIAVDRDQSVRNRHRSSHPLLISIDISE
jgi:hypothetical protein